MKLIEGHLYNLNGIHIYGFSTREIKRFEEVMYTGARNGEEDFFSVKNIQGPFAPDLDRLRFPQGMYSVKGNEVESDQIIREVAVFSWDDHSDGVKKYLIESLILAASPPASEKKHVIKMHLLNHIAPRQHLYDLGKSMGFTEEELIYVNRLGPVDMYQKAVMEAFPNSLSLYITNFKPLEDIVRSP